MATLAEVSRVARRSRGSPEDECKDIEENEIGPQEKIRPSSRSVSARWKPSSRRRRTWRSFAPDGEGGVRMDNRELTAFLRAYASGT